VIGPTIIALAAGMLLNIGSFPALAEQVSRDPALIFVSGILLFVAGLAIVRVHNRWTNGWPVLVTVLGCLSWVAFPNAFSNRARRDCRRNWLDHRRDHCSSHPPPWARHLSLAEGIST
jgi:hypothetical protein